MLLQLARHLEIRPLLSFSSINREGTFCYVRKCVLISSAVCGTTLNLSAISKQPGNIVFTAKEENFLAVIKEPTAYKPRWMCSLAKNHSSYNFLTLLCVSRFSMWHPSPRLSFPWCLEPWEYDRAEQGHVKTDFGPRHLLVSLFYLSQKGPICLLLHICEKNTWMVPHMLLLERNGNSISRAHTKSSLHVSRRIRQRWHIHCSRHTDTSWNVRTRLFLSPPPQPGQIPAVFLPDLKPPRWTCSWDPPRPLMHPASVAINFLFEANHTMNNYM